MQRLRRARMAIAVGDCNRAQTYIKSAGNALVNAHHQRAGTGAWPTGKRALRAYDKVLNEMTRCRRR